MSPEMIVLLTVGLFMSAVVIFVVYRLLPKRLKPQVYSDKWLDIQAFCKDKTTWPQALTDADALLDQALKKRKFKGKSMGERMVSAQKVFTNNDTVWYAHNLYKKVSAEPSFRLREAEVKAALLGFRQALRDLGALANPKDEQKRGDA